MHAFQTETQSGGNEGIGVDQFQSLHGLNGMLTGGGDRVGSSMQVGGHSHVVLEGHEGGLPALVHGIVSVQASLNPTRADSHQDVVGVEDAVRVVVPDVAIVQDAVQTHLHDGAAHLGVLFGLVDGEHFGAISSSAGDAGDTGDVGAQQAVDLLELGPLLEVFVGTGDRNAHLGQLGVLGVTSLLGLVQEINHIEVAVDLGGDGQAQVSSQRLVEAGGVHLHGVLHRRNGVDLAVDLHGVEEVIANKSRSLGSILQQVVHGHEGALLGPLNVGHSVIHVDDVHLLASHQHGLHLLAVLGGIDELEVDLDIDLLDHVLIDGIPNHLVGGGGVLTDVPSEHNGLGSRGKGAHAEQHGQSHHQGKDLTHW